MTHYNYTVIRSLKEENLAFSHCNSKLTDNGKPGNHLPHRKGTCDTAFVAMCTSSLWRFVWRYILCLCQFCSQDDRVLGSGDFPYCPGLRAGLHFGQVTSLTCTGPMQRDNHPYSCQSLYRACLWTAGGGQSTSWVCWVYWHIVSIPNRVTCEENATNCLPAWRHSLFWVQPKIVDWVTAPSGDVSKGQILSFEMWY